ncbi:UNVERIFIED_CONTAM: hypothetical protein Sradi_3468200 [Sesamum radiatum]|uniref:Uncharacterized protein n=1 Tax=Sesamum radiatum TaxID=300843 RepID=A0AAW2QD86_SESRA
MELTWRRAEMGWSRRAGLESGLGCACSTYWASGIPLLGFMGSEKQNHGIGFLVLEWAWYMGCAA